MQQNVWRATLRQVLNQVRSECTTRQNGGYFQRRVTEITWSVAQEWMRTLHLLPKPNLAVLHILCS